MNKVLSKVAVLFLLIASVQADEASWTSSRGLFAVTYQSELDPLQINTLHAWVLHIEDAGGDPIVGAVIEASGGMPKHDHGLPTQPRITKEMGDGNYRLEGMRFHMQGEWEVTLTITAEAKTDIVVVKVTL